MVTHPRVFEQPTPLSEALSFGATIRDRATDRDFTRFPNLRTRHPLD